MRASVIVNPAAGSRFRGDVNKAISDLRGGMSEVEVSVTEGPGQATELARRAADDGYDLVVACGGDGTVSEVANGLAGSGTPLGVLPAGTVNIWAAEAGIPRDLRKAARVLLDGVAWPVDLGLAGSRYFLLMAGLGLDGAVARNLSLPMKRTLGRAAYLMAGIWTLTGFEGARADIRVDGQKLERDVVWIVIGNTRLYGGYVTVTPHARVDDGLLDLCIFSGRSLLASTGGMIALLGKRHLALESVEYRQCREVVVESARPLPFQADGDYVANTPQVFRVAPGALRVVLPSGRRASIFSEPFPGSRVA